jgi:ligand-binding SRPBCC domain-containing protein
MPKAHSIKAVQKIPVPIETVWAFFSNPANLAAITPSYMDFRVISNHHGPVVYAGQIIEYRVKPVAGIPLYWMTEIRQVQPLKMFIDEQRYGPYSLWHHQHHFKAIEGGTEMTDIVHYKMPLGPLGRLANRLFLKRRLRQIFEYRFEKTNELLGPWPGQQLRVEMY